MNKRIVLFNVIYYAITLWFILLGRQDASSSLGYGFFILIFWLVAGVALLFLLIRKKIETKSIFDKIGIITATPILTIIFVAILLNVRENYDAESHLRSFSLNEPPTRRDCLPDHLFVSFQLNASISLDTIMFDQSDYYYDGKKLIELDSQQKEWWIKPFVKVFPANSYKAHFVSKLSSIHNLQPVILRVAGTDYETLWLLLLNKNCEAVGLFYLEGENCEGPMENDSTVVFCPVRRNRMRGNSLITHETRISESLTSGHRVIDSLTFATTIDRSGRFVTKRLDSIRFYKKPTH